MVKFFWEVTKAHLGVRACRIKCKTN